jgi:hypothetical protein
MRTYVTQHDHDIEDEVTCRLSIAWSASPEARPVEWVRAPRHARCSHFIIDAEASFRLDAPLGKPLGTIRALADIRARRYTMEKIESMGGLMVDASKIRFMVQTALALDIDALLIVRDADKRIFVCDLIRTGANALDAVSGGRTDRGDPRDIDAVVMLRLDMFDEVRGPLDK